MMSIILSRPPNFAAIVAVFPDAEKAGIIFSYGRDIYNPSNAHISNALLAHEEVHGRRQTDSRPKIHAWWDRYLIDAEFRLSEELPAHQAEFRAACAQISDRNLRGMMCVNIAKRLSSPLYGSMITFTQAMKAIRA